MDRSTKGSYDDDIVELLTAINKHAEYKTTSSCSGRIAIIDCQKKAISSWLFKSHDTVKADDIIKTVKNCSETVWFMQEPLIIHVKCASLDAAEKLLEIAHATGLKHSGIISLKSLMVELRSHERVEVPVNKKFNDEELQVIVLESNGKLLRTKEKIQKLFAVFEKEKL